MISTIWAYRLALNWYIVVCYWIFALLCLVMRIRFTWFGRLCSYSKSQCLYGKSNGDKLSAACSISRRTAFKAFYFIGIISTLFFIGVSNRSQLRTGSLIYEGMGSVPVALLCYLFHVSRRFYECGFVHKFSNSRLSLFAFLAGASFYVFVPLTYSTCDSVTFGDLTIDWTRNWVCAQLILFGLASVCQSVLHADLASLRHGTHEKKSPNYTAPPFQTALFPHYSMEIGVYILLSSFASDVETIRIFSLPAFFTIANLSVTASEQRKSYVFTSSRRRIELPKYNILPWIF